jgi:4-hydroxy-tetrahydrodipicolinate reductase
MAVKIALLGMRGRMGLALIEAIKAQPKAHLSAATERTGHPDVGQCVAHDINVIIQDNAQAALAAADVGIDFSSPKALTSHLQAACATQTPLVIGTTGLEAAHDAAITAACTKIAILQSANMSLGIALLSALVYQAAAKLGSEWDIEIVEMHHRHKVDAPSGTALLLGQAAAHGRSVALDDVAERGRDGIHAPRQSGAIGFASLRGGSVAGDHSVFFATDQEHLKFTHHAQSRSIFAKGALEAALWLHTKSPGRYTISDVLGI